MTDDLEYEKEMLDILDGEETAVRETILRHARTSGFQAAYAATLEIAGDKKAPAAARGAAARTILEIGGVLNWKDRAQQQGVEKNLSEMDGSEFWAAARAVKRRLARESNPLE